MSKVHIHRAEKSVFVMLTEEDAEGLDHGLSDFLCWAEGFEAARAGTDLAHKTPWGVEAIRDLRTRLQRALREANERKLA